MAEKAENEISRERADHRSQEEDAAGPGKLEISLVSPGSLSFLFVSTLISHPVSFC